MEHIKLSYLNSDYTRVDFGFSKKLQGITKSCGGRFFDSGTVKYWYVERRRTLDLINTVKKRRVPLSIDKEMQIEFTLSKRGRTQAEVDDRKRKKAADPSYAVKADYDTTYLNFREGFDLYPYQKAGLKYAISKNGRVLFGDDMGLGKTPQGIAMARHYKDEWPLMVIAPASLLFNWKKEIMMWLPDIKESDITIIKKGSQKPKGMITIASYDYAIKQEREIKDYLGIYGVMLIDEAHNMKTPEAKRTKSLLNICHIVSRLAIITGTPFLSRPKEAFALVNALYPNHEEFNNQEQFEEKFCEASTIKIGYRNIYQANGAANIEEFHDLIRGLCMVRRSKEDEGVLDQLPKKRRLTQYLEVESKNRENVDELMTEITYRVLKAYKEKGGNDLRSLKKAILSAATAEGAEDDIFKAYRLTGMAKVNSICDWLSEKLDDSEAKFIVFGHHKDFLSGITDVLDKKKIEYMKIDGSTSKEKRFNNTENFQNDPKCRVAVLSIQAASVGLTLTAASEVIMGEFPWTPALAQQAECRAHRNGQKELVNCYYMIANNTIDGYLWNMLSKKSEVSSLMLDGGDGDEMEEEITMETGDILDSIILSIHSGVLKGLVNFELIPDELIDASELFLEMVKDLNDSVY